MDLLSAQSHKTATSASVARAFSCLGVNLMQRQNALGDKLFVETLADKLAQYFGKLKNEDYHPYKLTTERRRIGEDSFSTSYTIELVIGTDPRIPLCNEHPVYFELKDFDSAPRVRLAYSKDCVNYVWQIGLGIDPVAQPALTEGSVLVNKQGSRGQRFVLSTSEEAELILHPYAALQMLDVFANQVLEVDTLLEESGGE